MSAQRRRAGRAAARAAAGSEYPVIRTKPSLSARLENVLTTCLQNQSMNNMPFSATKTGQR
jgi:hypothetical protein